MERKRRQMMPEMEADTSNLPYEVMYIILSKLPAKSLIRFRCVCKLWRTLISEPNFIKSHLTEAIKSDRRRILCSLYSFHGFFNIDYENSVTFDESEEEEGGGEAEEKGEGEEIFFPNPIEKYRKGHVFSSCNGLIVLGLGVERMVVVWNPSTNAYIKLSCPPTFPYIDVCGLCYDSLTDDHKLVFVNWNGFDQNYYVVYTFKSNSWTESKEFNYWVHYAKTGVSVNGAPHWIMISVDSKGDRRQRSMRMSSRLFLKRNPRRRDYQDSRPYMYDSRADYVIVYFDSVDDDFKEVPPPYWMQKGYLFKLMVIREWLGLYISTSDHKLVEVWAMKEYGVRDSWTKLFSIPCEGSFQGISPLTVTKKGEVVVYRTYHNQGLKLYDPKEVDYHQNPYKSIHQYNISYLCG